MPRQGLTRRDVFSACFQLIDEKGFEGFSMHELARRLNIRTASLYNHIENVATLLSRIGQTATERFTRALTEAVGEKEGRDGLLAYCRGWTDFAAAHPGLYAVVMRTMEEKEPWEKPPFFLPLEKLVEGDERKRDLILCTLHGAVSLEGFAVLPPPAGKGSRPETVATDLLSLMEKGESRETN